MKKILATLLLLTALGIRAQVMIAENVSSLLITSDTSGFTVTESYDTTFVRNFSIQFGSLEGVSKVRLELAQLGEPVNVLSDTTYTLPVSDVSNSGTLEIGRTGTTLSIKLGSFSLMNRYRVRFFTLDGEEVQTKVAEQEF